MNPDTRRTSSPLPSLAVIILNWNGLGLLKRFLPSAAANTQGPGVELVVADNGSTDGSAAWVRENFPEVRVIAFDRNHGFAGGYNLAVGQVEADCVTLLNSDVETPPGWWEPLVEFMAAHPEAGAVMPKILSERDRGSFEYAGAAGGYLDALGYPWCRGRLFDVTERDRGQYDGPPEAVAWASGACLTVWRRLYLEAGGLDPAFFAHMEEIDLCVRLWRSGHPVYALTDSCVYHVGGASLPQGNPRKTYLNFRNNLLLLYKNLPPKRGRRLLFIRRLADTLALGMFLLKGDTANARAVWNAHRDFRKMRGQYTDLPQEDIWPLLPGTRRHATASRMLLRRKSLKP